MSNAITSELEKLAIDSEKVAEALAYRFKGQNNYFRLSVGQGLQRSEVSNAPALEDVTVHTKAYLGSAWADITIDRLVDALLRAVEVFPWQTTRETFEQMMEKYIQKTRMCMKGITIEAVKQHIQEVVSMLESIKVCSYSSKVRPSLTPHCVGDQFERGRMA